MVVVGGVHEPHLRPTQHRGTGCLTADHFTEASRVTPSRQALHSTAKDTHW